MKSKKKTILQPLDLFSIKIFVALLMTLLLTIRFSRTGNIEWTKGMFQLPETIVYIIFGVFHSLLITKQNNEKFQEHPVYDFVGNMFLFSAFYKMILLPFCGLGLIQWVAIAVMFLIELISIAGYKNTKQPKYDNTLFVYLGIGFLIIKMIMRYGVKMDLASDLSGNTTAMNFVAAMIAFAAVFAIKTAFSSIKINTRNTTNNAKKIGNQVGKIFSKIGTFVLSIITNPIILLIVIIAIFLVGVALIIVAGAKLNGMILNIRNDIVSMISSVLYFVLDTDNAAYSDDSLTAIGQVSSLIIFMIAWRFDLSLTKNIEDNNKIEDNKNKNEEARKITLKNLRLEESKKQIEKIHSDLNLDSTKQKENATSKK